MIAYLLILLILLGAAPSAAEETLLATVNGENVTLAMYKRFVAKVRPKDTEAALDGQTLRKLIEEVLIIQEARRQGVSATDNEVDLSIRDFLARSSLTAQDFEKTITGKGITMMDYRNWLKESIILAKYLDAEVDRKIILTESDVRNYYSQNMRIYLERPETLDVQAAFFKTADTPETITELKIRLLAVNAEIERGEPFAAVAERHSDTPLRETKGKLGSFRKGELMPALDNVLAEMKEGEIRSPVWTKQGVYILRLEKRTPAEYTPLEKARENIETLLYDMRREERYKELIQSLLEKAAITIHKQ